MSILKGIVIGLTPDVFAMAAQRGHIVTTVAVPDANLNLEIVLVYGRNDEEIKAYLSKSAAEIFEKSVFPDTMQ